MVRKKGATLWDFRPGTGTGTFEVTGIDPGTEIEVRLAGPLVETTTLTAPRIAAIVSPNPIVAGQPFTVVFDVVPDTVTPAGLTGTGSIRSGVGPAGVDRLTIRATADGREPLEFEVDVEQPEATLIVSPENILRIDGGTGPTPLTISAPDRYAGEYAPGAADLETGPQPLADIVLRTVSGAPAAVGQSLVLDLGPWESQHPQVQITSIRYRAGDTILGTASTLAITSALAGQSIVADYALSDASGVTEGTTPAVAVPGTVLAVGATRVGFYDQVRVGATNTQRLTDIDLGPADPAKRMVLFVSTRGDFTPTFAVIAGGVEYPLEEVTRTGPQSNSATGYLLEANIPAGGAAVLRATYTANTSPGLGVEVFALKGMARQTLVSNLRVAMTAGTPVSVQVATQANDFCLLFLVSVPTAAGGIIDATAGVTEVIDRTLATGAGLSPWQLWIGAATEATGSATRTLSATPTVSGNAGRLAAVYRRS
ncbi:hypothetical protein [Paracoccus sp. 22332]|uniref:hypothetical protein n=1 Tax=Paracoccus sp. 22332 TaxID=3453913 RepID=UPI003F860CEF